MKIVQKCLACIISLIFINRSTAQETENGGWLFLSHTQKLSEKFDLLADLQLRTSDKWDYLQTVLVRPALSYHLNEHHSVAAGYVYKGDRERMSGNTEHTRENRIFEQYQHEFKAGKTEFQLRGRLEQRFVREEGDENFSQRIRGFVSVQFPIWASPAFREGLYGNLQNELFANVQNKELVNDSFFDQNRTYAAFGYRFSKQIDLDAGYLFWYQREDDGNYRRHIIQIRITTNL